MERLIELAAIATGVVLSLPVALWLEWICLRATFALMPVAGSRRNTMTLRAAWPRLSSKVSPAVVKAGNR
jgi:hypothetical protein